VRGKEDAEANVPRQDSSQLFFRVKLEHYSNVNVDRNLLEKLAAHTLPRNDKSYQTLRDVLGIATTIQFAWILTVTSLDGIQYNICIMNYLP